MVSVLSRNEEGYVMKLGRFTLGMKSEVYSQNWSLQPQWVAHIQSGSRLLPVEQKDRYANLTWVITHILDGVRHAVAVRETHPSTVRLTTQTFFSGIHLIQINKVNRVSFSPVSITT
jgi:hypothetical protein